MAGRARANLRLLTRGLLALGLAALVALVVRLRGRGGAPPRDGGWKELPADDLSPQQTGD